jgi:hypothetical protein
MVEVLRVTDDTPRELLAELLVDANRDAKRQPHVFGVCAPSAWDEAHELIDELLDDWEQAPA